MSPRSQTRSWRRRWLAVFSLNLITPLFFGFIVTEGAGRIGMFLAIVPLWLWAYRLGTRSRHFAYAMTVGGTVVGLLQIYPVLQMFAGIAALMAAGPLVNVGVGKNVSTAPGGVIVTMVTGGLLQLIALAIGEIAYLLLVRRHGGFSTPDGKPPAMPREGSLFDREMDAF
jgi:hypothetical protein